MIHYTFIWRLVWLPASRTKLVKRFIMLLCLDSWETSFIVLLIVIWTYWGVPKVLIWHINCGLFKRFHVFRGWRWNTSARHPQSLLIRCHSRFLFKVTAKSMLFWLTLYRNRACDCLIPSARICIFFRIILNFLSNCRCCRRLFKLLLCAPHCCWCPRK